MRSLKKSLWLEVLEARALFAGGDLVAPSALAANFQGAILTSAPIDFDVSPSGTRLTLIGTPDADLVIDFNKLPDTITSISLSNFDSVKFEGNDSLFNLYASDVRSVEAPSISVQGSFIVENVENISLKYVGGLVQISGGNVVTAKIDDLSGWAAGTPIHLKSVNALILETKSPTLNFESISGSAGLVIALPNVPSSWDPTNVNTWKSISGLDNVQSQLRLGTRDIRVIVAEEKPEVPISVGNGGGLNQGEAHNPGSIPTIEPDPGVSVEPEEAPTSTSEIDLRAFFDRLEVLFNQAGGFKVLGYDNATIKRVVAELAQGSQDVKTSGVPVGLPHEAFRREIDAPLIEASTRNQTFTSFVEAKTAPVIDLAESASGFYLSGLPRDQVLGAEKGSVEYIEIENTLRRVDPSADTTSASLRVTVDPEAPTEVSKPGLMGIFSLFIDRAVDLKQYVLNQISQEVSPGERTGVLLVDPKPVRPVHQNKLLG
ncbi:MAG TPA: hypothetical protein PLN52_22455 [Opitutaceae bacterium]|nr:hypothetical protein [Opitutaceae bacterium]